MIAHNKYPCPPIVTMEIAGPLVVSLYDDDNDDDDRGLVLERETGSVVLQGTGCREMPRY